MPVNNKQTVFPVLILLTGFIVIYAVIHLLFGVFSQPYLWDELGVYSRASMYLYENGLSLLPSAVPDELSRGHPLLCSFYFALAFKLFGCAPATAHVAAALLNMAGFYCCFQILRKYMPVWHAVIATWAIFVQPLFLSQSVLILPEMPLMTATLAAVMFYVHDRKWGVMLSLVACLQIKESALVLPVAFLLADLLRTRKLSLKTTVYYFLLPVLSFCVFIFIQKVQRGYYFYPLHTSLSSFDPYFIRERWDNFRQYAFHEQGLGLYAVIFLLAVILWTGRNISRLKSFMHSRVIVLPVIIAGAVAFLVLNYFLSRYTMYFMVLYMAILLMLINAVFERYEYLRMLLLVIVVANGVLHWNNGKTYTDVDFSYAAHLVNMQEVVTEVNKDLYKGKTIGMDFPLCAAYWSKNNGYQTSGHMHSVPIHDALPKDFVVFTHPGNMADTANYGKDIVLVKELKTAYAFSRIYRLKHP